MRGGQYIQIQTAIPDITFELRDGGAVDLVTFDRASQSVSYNQEAFDAIMEWDGAVSFVFNIGQRAVGKSTLFSQALDLAVPGNCFAGRNSGIKMWTRPLYKEEENLHTFFVDVEGVGEELVTSFAFLLAYLLGSVVVFSSSGELGPAAWAQLGELERTAKRLVVSENSAENIYSLSFYAPKFLWVARDLEIKETDAQGLPLPADQYLEASVLDPNVI